jgi:hypothetical protein
MRRRDSRWSSLLAAVFLVLAGALAAPAQETESGEEPPVEDDFLESEPRPEIDELLFDDMEVLAGEGETYDPGDRRDPFLSLLEERIKLPGPECTDVGIPCLKIGDIEVTGIFITGAGAVAQIRGADARKSFLIREGDQLYDGDVTSIAFDEVVFRQRTEEGLKPFQPVVKKLKPQGGKGS